MKIHLSQAVLKSEEVSSLSPKTCHPEVILLVHQPHSSPSSWERKCNWSWPLKGKNTAFTRKTGLLRLSRSQRCVSWVKRPFFFLFAEGWENRCEDVSGTNIWLRAWAGKQMGPLQVCGCHSGKKGDVSAIGLLCACSWFYSYSSSVWSWRWEFRGSSQGSESVCDMLGLQSW